VTDWCRPFQIRPQTIVGWTIYATNYFSSNDYGVTMFHRVFLNYKAMNILWWWALLNSLDTIPAHTLLNLQSLKSQTNDLSLKIPLDSPTSTFEPAKPLDIALTFNQEKFTQSCLCESPSDLGAMLALCFVDPKTSWPSKWGILVVKEDPLVSLAMALAIYNGLLYWLIHHSFNSSLPRPSPHLPPFKYTL